MSANWPPPQRDELPARGWVWSDFTVPTYDFAKILRAAGLMPVDEDEYWDKPWKWSGEHQGWIAAGEPAPPRPGEPETLAWRRFLRHCASLQS